MILLILIVSFITSCSFQKYFSDNGNQISKKIYNKMRERRFDYVMKYMNDDDKSIIKQIKITKSVRDSLIETYSNYWEFVVKII